MREEQADVAMRRSSTYARATAVQGAAEQRGGVGGEQQVVVGAAGGNAPNSCVRERPRK